MTTRFDRTSSGFHAIVLSPRDEFYIAPLSREDTRTYMSYFTPEDGATAGRCLVGPGDNALTRRNDTGNNRLLTIASAPTPGAATVLCSFGPGLGQVRGPEGLTIAAFTTGPLGGVSSIVVSDTTNNRIQSSRLPVAAGSWVLLGTGPGAGTGQFNSPSKIR